MNCMINIMKKRKWKVSKYKYFDRSLYNVWSNMKQRCYNKSIPKYKSYGARGIEICDEWLSDYDVFAKWCLDNGWNKALQIDRVDVDGNYCPENCRFVTNKVNSRNKTTNKMTVEKAEVVRLLKDRFKYSDQALSNMFGICRRSICYIVNNKQWV